MRVHSLPEVLRPFNALSLTINYGHIHRDESLLLKIPKHKVGLNVAYKLNTNTQLSLNSKFVDATRDFGDVALPSYRIVNLFLNHMLIENRLTVFGSVTNLFNEDYQEIAGFSTRGRNYKLGLKLKF
jgi:vitamin B12 transporter